MGTSLPEPSFKPPKSLLSTGLFLGSKSRSNTLSSSSGSSSRVSSVLRSNPYFRVPTRSSTLSSGLFSGRVARISPRSVLSSSQAQRTSTATRVSPLSSLFPVTPTNTPPTVVPPPPKISAPLFPLFSTGGRSKGLGGFGRGFGYASSLSSLFLPPSSSSSSPVNSVTGFEIRPLIRKRRKKVSRRKKK